MTSKEALEYILENSTFMTARNCKKKSLIPECWDAIKKDLEVLEIIKNVVTCSPMTIRAIEVSENYEKYEKNCEIIGCLTTTKIVYQKLKEWIEHDSK